MLLKGKTAFITGGSSGIGEATAMLFAKEGAKVAIAARGIPAAQKVVDKISALGGTAMVASCDVTNMESVNSAALKVINEWGNIDILINSAGVAFMKTLIETSSDEWDLFMNTNVKSVFHTGKAIIPHMIEQGKGGIIVNVASSMGLVGSVKYSAYCATKGAIINLTRAMALDLAPYNIRVNCLCSGPVDTPMLMAEFLPNEEGKNAFKALEDAHPLKRISRPKNKQARYCFYQQRHLLI
ncbi:hypothetical protein B566_EDAN019557 [Ephemera danica]|nr:hypothetical protein B566_EDAN019557 [Ephemera danica]